MVYQNRLHKIQKAMNNGKLEINDSETSFLIRIYQTKEEDFTDSDKEEINRLWCKI